MFVLVISFRFYRSARIVVMAGLVPAISMRMAQCSLIEIAGTSPAMTM